MTIKKAAPPHEHDREVDWLKVKGARTPHFQVYCTTCDARSPVLRLSGHQPDAMGFPKDLAQACDDVLDQAARWLP